LRAKWAHACCRYGSNTPFGLSGSSIIRRTTLPGGVGFEVAEEIGQTALALGPAEEVQVAGHKAPGKYYQLLVLLQ